jgi:hypothetical protein
VHYAHFVGEAQRELLSRGSSIEKLHIKGRLGIRVGNVTLGAAAWQRAGSA